MSKKIVLVIVLIFSFIIYAQKASDSSVSFGNNTIEWRIFDTDEPVTAFAISGTSLWYTTGTKVGLCNVNTNEKNTYQKLGEASSSGIKTIAFDYRNNFWFGGEEGAIVLKNKEFTLFTKGKGLSDNKVNSIYCTSGSVWIGTENGLSQYKSGSWKVYTTEQGMSGNSIRDITSDNKGRIWVATNKGVSVLSNGIWKKYDMKSGLSWNDAKAIAYDTHEGILWTAVGEQDVNSFDGKKWEVFMDIQPDMTSIMVDTQSRIWFGSKVGILKYNGDEWISDPAKIGFPAAQVNDMYRDNKGDLYFAIGSGVLHMKNPYPF